MPKNGRKYAKFEGELGWKTQGSRRSAARDKSEQRAPVGKQAQGQGSALRGKGGGGAAFVIPGAKREPHWKCSGCRFAENWRCRTACWQRGASAPEKHVKQVMAEVVGGAGGSGGPAKRQAAGGGGTASGQAAAGDPAAELDRDAARRELQEGQRALDAAKRWGFSEGAIAAMQAELDSKRARFQAAKPRAALVKLAERRAAELADKLAGHRKKEEALRTAVAEAAARLSAHQEAEAALTEKLAAARADLDQQRIFALAEGEGEDDEASDPMDSLPAAWKSILAKRQELGAELRQEYRAFVAERKAEALADEAAAPAGCLEKAPTGESGAQRAEGDLVALVRALAAAGSAPSPQDWETICRTVSGGMLGAARAAADAGAAAASAGADGPSSGKRAKMADKDGDGDTVM